MMGQARRIRPKNGQGMVEYGLIIGLIAVLIITSFIMFRRMADTYEEGAGSLSDADVGKRQASLSAGIY